jgi:transcriptional regulator with XRE-family HTH domain
MNASPKNTATSDVDAWVGERVRRRRKLLNMSGEALAGLLKLSTQQLQKCEGGKNRIGAGRLYDIAVLLRVPVSYFYEGLDPSVSDNAASTIPVSGIPKVELVDAQSMKLARAFARIADPKLRKGIADMIHDFAEESAN